MQDLPDFNPRAAQEHTLIRNEELAAMLGYDIAQFKMDITRVIYLLGNCDVRPYVDAAVHQGRLAVPHLAGIYDDPKQASEAIAQEHSLHPDKIMVLRLFSTSDTYVVFKEPLVIDAEIRLAVIGDRSRQGSYLLGYLPDTSKFGGELLETSGHRNLVCCNVGFHPTPGDFYKRVLGGCAASSSTIVAGVGPKVAPLFGKAVIGSWGVPAIVGATAVPAAVSGIAGYHLYKVYSQRAATSGRSTSDIPNYGRLRLTDVFYTRREYAEAEQALFDFIFHNNDSPDEGKDEVQGSGFTAQPDNGGRSEIKGKDRKLASLEQGNDTSFNASSRPPAYTPDFSPATNEDVVTAGPFSERAEAWRLGVLPPPRQHQMLTAFEEKDDVSIASSTDTTTAADTQESFPINRERLRPGCPTADQLRELRRQKKRQSVVFRLFHTPLFAPPSIHPA